MLKDLRKALGITQTEFGQKLGGVPLRTIQNWEAGTHMPQDWVMELIMYRIRHDDQFKINDQEAEEIAAEIAAEATEGV